jgi:hypothetical protein
VMMRVTGSAFRFPAVGWKWMGRKSAMKDREVYGNYKLSQAFS